MTDVNRNYITSLKNEHETLMRRLERIKDFMEKKDIDGAFVSLNPLKNILFVHFKKEEKLYGELLNAARNDKTGAMAVNTYVSVIWEWKTGLLAFSLNVRIWTQ